MPLQKIFPLVAPEMFDGHTAHHLVEDLRILGNPVATGAEKAVTQQMPVMRPVKPCRGRRSGAALLKGSVLARRPTPTALTFINGTDGDLCIWWTHY